MTDRLYAKYLWLINTVYEAGKISFEEVARKWDDAYINDLHQPSNHGDGSSDHLNYISQSVIIYTLLYLPCTVRRKQRL